MQQAVTNYAHYLFDDLNAFMLNGPVVFIGTLVWTFCACLPDPSRHDRCDDACRAPHAMDGAPRWARRLYERTPTWALFAFAGAELAFVIHGTFLNKGGWY